MALWLLIDRERATRGTGTDGRKMKDGKQAKAKGAHLHHLLTSIVFSRRTLKRPTSTGI